MTHTSVKKIADKNKMFQFLIGKIMTQLSDMQEWDEEKLFQFLIGKIMTNTSLLNKMRKK